ncbi:hypothetical protein, partial [Zestomonas carbonaria]|uniref:hypothetical protein n=1 Tax=Zestomonas carbonaria TaxID=2762745 RepID=UPI001B357D5D
VGARHARDHRQRQSIASKLAPTKARMQSGEAWGLATHPLRQTFSRPWNWASPPILQVNIDADL